MTNPDIEQVPVHLLIQQFAEHMGQQCDRRRSDATNEVEYNQWHDRGQAFWLMYNYIQDTFVDE